MKKAVSVLAPSFVITYILSIAAALDQIGTAFPTLPQSTIQMLTSLPSLIAMPVILISGYLTSWLRKKQIIVLSLIIMCIGGFLPLFAHDSFYVLIISMSLTGLGYGGLAPLSSALITEHYQENQRPAMLGYQSAVIGIGGVCFSFLGGILSTKAWWHVFYVFLLFVPVIILSVFLPKGDLSGRPAQNDVKAILNTDLLMISGIGFVFCVFFFVFQNNIASYLTDYGIGNASLAGTVLSVQSGIGIVSGLICGPILDKFKSLTFPYICTIGGGGLLIVHLFPGKVTVFISALLLGFIFSIRMPAGYLQVAASVPSRFATIAITVFCCICQVGQFLSPVLNNGVCALLKFPNEKQFLIGGILLCLTGLVGLTFYRKKGAGALGR